MRSRYSMPRPTLMDDHDGASEAILVSPVIWQKLVLRLDRPSLSMLWTLHSHGVGAPPEVCGGLSRFVMAPGTAMLHTMWMPIIQRLEQSAKKLVWPRSDSATIQARLKSGLQVSWHTAVSRVVLPISRLACERLRQNYLFCEDDGVAAIADQHYRDYQKKFIDTLSELPKSAKTVTDTFWDGLALQLITLALRSGDPDVRRSSMSVPQAAALIRLEPEVTRVQRDNPPVLKLARRFWLVDPRRGDPGVDGVKQSRNESDLPRILPSELMNPPLLLADRLVNDGVLVFRRPPRPIRRREFLIVGIMPPQVATSAVAPFLRACWLEFMSCTHRVLADSGHLRSELRFVEATDQAHMRTLSLYAGDLGAQARLPMAESNPLLHRSQLGSLSGFFPVLGDTRAIPDAVKLSLGEDAGAAATSRWTIAAWSAQRDHAGWRGGVSFLGGQGPRDHNANQALRVDQYAFVWVLLFLPPGEESEQVDASFLRNPLRWSSLLSPAPHAVCLCEIPNSDGESQNWRLSGRDGRQTVPSRVGHLKDSPNSLAGKLLDYWTTDLVKGAQDE